MAAFKVSMLLFVLALFWMHERAAGDECDWAPDPHAKPNAYPIDDAPLRFSHGVPNGKAYVGGQPGFEFFVAHLYGSDYEMGHAHGALFPKQIADFMAVMWTWLEAQIESGFPKSWPAWFSDMVANAGLAVALDALADADAPFIGQNIQDELRGLADGSGVSHALLRRIHLIAELTQGQCSLYGAWGNATAYSKTLMMRAFDWNSGCPCKSYPALLVYHPGRGGSGHAWINVAWTGWIGTFTALSSARTAIGMIGVEYPDASFGNQSFVGVPFVYIMRDVAQFDTTYIEAIARIKAARRTCDLIVGVGDGKAGTFRGMEYSASVADVFDDTNMRPLNNSWHPRIPEVLYWGMDWLCPTFTAVLAQRIQAHYGSLTPENTIADITSRVQTGNVHEAIFDLTDNVLYVSFMAGTNSSVPGLPPFAYERQFSRFNATALFAETL